MIARKIGQMRCTLLVIALSALPLLGYGKTEPQNESLSTLLPKNCYSSGQFTQTRRQRGVAKPLLSYGAFVFSCDKGLIWHTQGPLQETLIYPLEGEVLTIIDGTTAPLDSRLQARIGKILNQLIGGQTDYIEKQFAVRTMTDKAVLRPKRKPLSKFLKAVVIEKKDGQVNINIENKNKESNSIAITQQDIKSSINLNRCTDLALVERSACAALFSP